MNISDYQKRPVVTADIVGATLIEPTALPTVILAVSPCRSGTTVLLRVFGSCGVQAHFQPLKNLLRWHCQDMPRSWLLPPMPNQPMLIKETIGPYTEAECMFNPLEVLLGAGYPSEKLRLLVVGRDPLTTWASWYAYWKGKMSVENFIRAYRTTENIRRQAQEHGIDTHCLVYETFRDAPPAQVFSRLFKSLGLNYSPYAVAGWERLPAFGSPGSNIVLADEPPIFVTENIHDKVEQSTEFFFNDRDVRTANLDPDDVQAVKVAELSEIYTVWKDACSKAGLQ